MKKLHEVCENGGNALIRNSFEFILRWCSIIMVLNNIWAIMKTRTYIHTYTYKKKCARRYICAHSNSNIIVITICSGIGGGLSRIIPMVDPPHVVDCFHCCFIFHSKTLQQSK